MERRDFRIRALAAHVEKTANADYRRVYQGKGKRHGEKSNPYKGLYSKPFRQ